VLARLACRIGARAQGREAQRQVTGSARWPTLITSAAVAS
jgi:hypothetical protein